jgi:hypothetical protein
MCERRVSIVRYQARPFMALAMFDTAFVEQIYGYVGHMEDGRSIFSLFTKTMWRGQY